MPHRQLAVDQCAGNGNFKGTRATGVFPFCDMDFWAKFRSEEPFEPGGEFAVTSSASVLDVHRQGRGHLHDELEGRDSYPRDSWGFSAVRVVGHTGRLPACL